MMGRSGGNEVSTYAVFILFRMTLIQLIIQAESDTAPFNFQGMLRKTTYNRASMKRTDVARDFGDSPKHFHSNNSYNNNNNNNNMGSSSSSSNHVVYQKSNNYASNKRSSNAGEDMNRNKSFGGREHPKTESTSSWLEQGETPAGSVYVSEEIHPGVVLEGYAIEI